MSIPASDLVEIGRRVADAALAGEAVEVFLSRTRQTHVRAYGGEIEQLESAEPIGAGVRVVAGRKQGFAHTATFDEAGLKEALEDARDNAGFAADDEWVGLAAPDGVAPPDIDICREDLLDIPAADKVEWALDLERRTISLDARVTTTMACEYVDGIAEEAVVTSTGIAACSRASFAFGVAVAMAVAGDETQVGVGLTTGRHRDDLDPDAAAREAVSRGIRLLGATKPKSARLTVVLDPEVTASFLGIIGAVLSGDEVLKGRSLFANRLGEEVAAPGVTLAEDPTVAASFGAALYDGEGLARRRVPLISGGRLDAFLYDSASARRAGSASTASAMRGYMSTPHVGASALSLSAGRRSQAELLADVGEGLYVQDVSGLHSGVNPVSGDFSVGATGMMIRGGALAEPVRELTIASTLQRMLKDIAAVGSDARWLPGNACGVTLVIGDVSASGR